MQAIPEMTAFDRGVRPIMEIVLPEKAEEIVEFRADPELQARIEELASKSTEGQLSEAEESGICGLCPREQIRCHSSASSSSTARVSVVSNRRTLTLAVN
jgi:hypothetical protein